MTRWVMGGDIPFSLWGWLMQASTRRGFFQRGGGGDEEGFIICCAGIRLLFPADGWRRKKSERRHSCGILREQRWCDFKGRFSVKFWMAIFLVLSYIARRMIALLSLQKRDDCANQDEQQAYIRNPWSGRNMAHRSDAPDPVPACRELGVSACAGD
jgi:hypothetical protein